jgi:hypothetical protein
MNALVDPEAKTNQENSAQGKWFSWPQNRHPDSL